MSAQTQPAHPGRRIAILSMLLLLAAALVSAVTWSVFRYRIESGPGLPVLGKVPNFTLVASSGQPVSQAELAGSVWVADFIFTTCPGMCPVLSAQMARVQKALADDAGSVRLVSFSVDPTTDTPEALRAYAQRFGADPQRWWFLTGERKTLYELIQSGFHLAVAERSEEESRDGEGLITHSDRFVLIDRGMQIRGYYHGTDEQDVQRLLHDMKKLQREGS